MVIGIGTDIVIIKRIEQGIERFGDNFLKKLLSANELKQLPEKMPRKAEWVAGRFACKEAAVKALGTGFSEGIAPTHIEILREEGKAPVMQLLDKAKQKADELGITHYHVSYSHEREHAIAFVTMEKRD